MSMGADLSRSLVLIGDENRFARLNALKSIKKYIVDGNVDSQILKEATKHLATALNDPVEVNRELALEILDHMIISLKNLSHVLPTVIPAIVQRLGNRDIKESSEELRLSTLNILYSIVQSCSDLGMYVDDFLKILQHTLADTYHEIKKLSCWIIHHLASKKYHRFYQMAGIILFPMLANLVHQHSKVRFETVRALGITMLYSQGKEVDSILPPLTQRLFDSAPSVRQCVIQTVASWLLDLPDRYSYQTRLLPLMLSGFVDASAELRSLTEELWHDIGFKFQKENWKLLKEKSDFDKGPPIGYPVGFRRPNLGCRELVYRSASRLLPPLCRDLSDWQEATRIHASGLIPILILHLEETTTQHVQYLISGLATGLSDAISRIASGHSTQLLYTTSSLVFNFGTGSPVASDRYPTETTYKLSSFADISSQFPSEKSEPLKVINQLLLSAKLIGCFVAPNLWWCLIEPCLGRCTESNAPSLLAGHLFLLSGLLSGSLSDQLNCSSVNETTESSSSSAYTSGNHNANATSNTTLIHRIVSYLNQDELISVMSFSAKAALLECVNVIIEHLQNFTLICNFNVNSNSADDGSVVADSNASDGSYRLFQLKSLRSVLNDICAYSSLFQILLGLSSVWSEEEKKLSEFGNVLLSVTRGKIKQLAICYKINCRFNLDQLLSNRMPVNSIVGDTTITESCVMPNETMINQKQMLCKPFVVNDSWMENEEDDIVDRIITIFIRKLLGRLANDVNISGSWHPRSFGLAMFSYCVHMFGYTLSMKDVMCSKSSDQHHRYMSSNSNDDLLSLVLDLLERGCGLNCAPKFDKSLSGSDPLTLASEAEIRLRGLMILIQLTDIPSIRQALASSAHLTRCLDRLILPVCVWCVGHTSEAMRKAASTCLITILATSISVNNMDKLIVDIRSPLEVKLDHWLCNNIGCVKQEFEAKLSTEEQCFEATDSERCSTQFVGLTTLSASLLSLLLARLGSLLDDDLDGTRQLACSGLTLLFNGILLPNLSSNSNSFFRSRTWLLSSDQIDGQIDLSKVDTPMPQSFGDQVYRFYPNLIKRLNDSKDKTRLLISDTINSWLRLLLPMLVNKSNGELIANSVNLYEFKLNPIHEVVMNDFIQGLLIHLDDSNTRIQAAICRIVARLIILTPDQIRSHLIKARQCYRSTDLCDQLLQLINTKL